MDIWLERLFVQAIWPMRVYLRSRSVEGLFIEPIFHPSNDMLSSLTVGFVQLVFLVVFACVGVATVFIHYNPQSVSRAVGGKHRAADEDSKRERENGKKWNFLGSFVQLLRSFESVRKDLLTGRR